MAGTNGADSLDYAQGLGDLFPHSMDRTVGANDDTQINFRMSSSRSPSTSHIDTFNARNITQSHSHMQPTMTDSLARQQLLARRANLAGRHQLQTQSAPNVPQHSHYNYTSPQMYNQVAFNPTYTVSINGVPANEMLSDYNTVMPQSAYSPSSNQTGMFQRNPRYSNVNSTAAPRQFQNAYPQAQNPQQSGQTTNSYGMGAQQPQTAIRAQNGAFQGASPSCTMAPHPYLLSGYSTLSPYHQFGASHGGLTQPSRVPLSPMPLHQVTSGSPTPPTRNFVQGAPHSNRTWPSSVLHSPTPSRQVATGTPNPSSSNSPQQYFKREAPFADDRASKRIKIENGNNLQTQLDRRFANSQTNALTTIHGSTPSAAKQYASQTRGAPQHIQQSLEGLARQSPIKRTYQSQAESLIDMTPKRKAESSVNMQTAAHSKHPAVESNSYPLSLGQQPSVLQTRVPETPPIPGTQPAQDSLEDLPPSSTTHPCNAQPKPPHPLQLRAPILWKLQNTPIDESLDGIRKNAYGIDNETGEEKEAPLRSPKGPTQFSHLSEQDFETLLRERLTTELAKPEDSDKPARPQSRSRQRKKGAKKETAAQDDFNLDCLEGYVPAIEVMKSGIGYIDRKSRN